MCTSVLVAKVAPCTDIHNPWDLDLLRFPVMARKVDVTDLVGAHEIAVRLGVARPQVVHEWRRRHPDFPQPIATLVTAMIWDWNDIERWAKATGRLRGT